MRRPGQRLLCPARLSERWLADMGQARVPAWGLCQGVLVERACPVAVRPGRGGRRAMWVAGYLRARSRADLVGPVLPAVMRAVLRCPEQARVLSPVES